MNLLKKRGRPRVGSGKNERLHIRMPEGYNNKIKTLKRVAFGFKNFTNFKARIMLLNRG